MTVQEQVVIGVPAMQGRTVELYDFRRPTTLAREHSRVLELAFETFARQWGTQLTAKVRAVSQVTCDEVVMKTYDEYASELPSTTAMVLCPLEDFASKAVFQFPAASALTWIGYMLGGSNSLETPERKFTQIEQAIVRRLMEDALEDLRYSLGLMLLSQISIDAIQYNSQFAQAAATSDLMIIATFTIRVGDSTTTSTFAIPAEAILPQLGEANPTSTTANARELITSQLGWAPVEISLRLNPATVSPARILELAVGDVLHIPHPKHRPLDIAVEGQPLALAAVGSNGSRLACVIVTTEEKS